MKTLNRIAVVSSTALAILFGAANARATTITFSTATNNDITGSFEYATENGFVYYAASGTLAVDDHGAPSEDITGDNLIGEGGGVLAIQTATAGLFTFSELDFGAFAGSMAPYFGNQELLVTGLRNGVVVANDVFTLQSDTSDFDWTAESAQSLLGKNINVLLIYLQEPAPFIGPQGFSVDEAEAVDNVVLGDAVPEPTSPLPPAPAVPEPSSLLLLGTGLLGVAASARRKIMGS